MLDNQIKNEGILKNLIILNNLVQKEIEFFLDKIGINYTEFSILTYIAKNNPTQYGIAKEYKISIQRINQIVIKLKKYGYIKKVEKWKNGKKVEVLDVEVKMQNQVEEINNYIVEIAKKKVDSKNLTHLNKELQILIDSLKNGK